MDEVDLEIARLEALEDEREAAWELLSEAIDRGVLADSYAGLWLSDDGETLVIAVTGDTGSATDCLRAISPSAPIAVVTRQHPMAELEALERSLHSALEAEGLPWSTFGIAVQDNMVDVEVPDLGHPAAERLRNRFAGQPLRWTQGDPPQAC